MIDLSLAGRLSYVRSQYFKLEVNQGLSGMIYHFNEETWSQAVIKNHAQMSIKRGKGVRKVYTVEFLSKMVQ